jgi:hypothetical protein
MKRLIPAIILATAAITAQANTVTLSCDITFEDGKQKTFQAELHLDPKSMSGQVEGYTVSIANFGNIYTIDTSSQYGHHFALNRETLAITDGITWTSAWSFFPDKYTGKCQKIQTNNQI